MNRMVLPPLAATFPVEMLRWPASGRVTDQPRPNAEPFSEKFEGAILPQTQHRSALINFYAPTRPHPGIFGVESMPVSEDKMTRTARAKAPIWTPRKSVPKNVGSISIGSFPVSDPFPDGVTFGSPSSLICSPLDGVRSARPDAMAPGQPWCGRFC